MGVFRPFQIEQPQPRQERFRLLSQFLLYRFHQNLFLTHRLREVPNLFLFFFIFFPRGWPKHCGIRTTKAEKDPWTASNLFTHPNSEHHTDFNTSHSHRTCIVSSARQRQRWHVRSEILYLLSRLTLPGTFKFPQTSPETFYSFRVWNRGRFLFWQITSIFISNYIRLYIYIYCQSCIRKWMDA